LSAPRRRVVDVQNGEPTSYEDALRQRNALIEDVQRIQSQLSERGFDDPEWRKSAVRALHAKQGDLRSMKEWLRKNDTRRQGEWALLARAYHVIEGLRDQQAMPDDHGGEIDAVLDEIEKTIPGKYLETRNEAG
jgi:hypothetical protein